MYLFNRCKSSCVKLAGNEMSVTSTFIDSAHEIVLEVQASVDDLVIKDVNISMVRVPHGICREVEVKARGLIGSAVAHGISRKIKRQIGGSQGCVHAVDVFLEAMKALKQGQYAWHFRNKTEQEVKEYFKGELEGTCYYHSRKSKTRGG